MPLIAGTMPWVKELAIGKGTVHKVLKERRYD